MKKSLVALAVMAAAGAASAQSSVSIYGILDAAYSRIGGDVASVKGLSNSGGGATTRLGFRGVEDLGGGLKAGFVLETEPNTDNGSLLPTNTNNLNSGSTAPTTWNGTAFVVSPQAAAGGLQFHRLSFISLAGNWGEVRLGRDIAASFYNEVVYDPFGAVGVGASLTVVNNAIGVTQFRASNAISYFLPNTLGGFTGQVMFAPGELASNSVNKDDGRYAGFRVGYAAGPLNAAFGYGRTTITYAAEPGVLPVGFIRNTTGAGTALNNGLSNDRTQIGLGGTYDFGVAKLWVNLSRQEIDNVTGAANVDRAVKGGLIGVTAPFGPHLIKAAYNRVTTETDGVALQPRSTKITLGYQFAFSKRTAFYTNIARVSNSSGANLTTGIFNGGVLGLGNPGSPGAVASANSSNTGFDIGLKHSF